MKLSEVGPAARAMAHLFNPAKLGPAKQPGCPHRLGRHLLRTRRSTQTYPDGRQRPAGHRGGRLVVDQTPCVWAAGHSGEHATADGRTWP